MPDLKGTMINRRKMLQGMAAGVGTVAGLSPLCALADRVRDILEELLESYFKK